MALGNLAAALVVARSRVLALGLGVLSVLAPLCLSRGWPIFRTVVAFGFAAGYLRVLGLVRSTAGTTLGSRVLSVVFLVFDARRIVRVPRSLQVRAFVVGAIEIAVAVALFLAPYPRGYGTTLMGACFAYFMVEGVAHLISGLVAAVGIDAGPFHDAPILARTLGEFWSKRWNRVVSTWLSDMVFRPVTRRLGVAAGVLATFGASAVLHTIPIWIAKGLDDGLNIGAFFLLHGVLVVVESSLRVARWPRWAGHTWTLAVFAVTLPLFVHPLLASLGRV